MAQRFSFVSQFYALSLSNLESLIMEAAPLARSLTSKPLPHIAIGVGSSGRVFIGMEVELPGLPLNLTIHAEQFLVVNLLLNLEPKLLSLAISNDGYSCFTPCGHCCQFLQEIRNASEIQILITRPTGQRDFIPLDTLLPQSFSRYANVHDLLQQRFHNVMPGDIDYEELKYAATRAAGRSYAPYTNDPSGVALMDGEGNVYSGSYIESVASMPSLGPVQAALVNFVIETGGREYENIIKAVLVERRYSRFPQADTVKMILNKIVPGCTFNVYHYP